MKTIAVFPTWLLIRAMIPWLPRNHPWHGRRFGLSDWSRGATPLTVQFGLVYWMGLVLLAMVVVFLGLAWKVT